MNGKREWKSFTAHSKKEAEWLAMQWSNTKKNRVNDITLREAYYLYIESKSNILSPNTLREYKRAMYNDFPCLLDYELVYIDNNVVQKEINKLTAINSPKTVMNKYNLLKAVIKYSNGNDIEVALPQKQKIEIHVPTEQEMQALYSTVKGTIMELPFLLASQCGLRAGEICGLNLSDFDKKHNQIRISKALAFNGSEWIIKAPKSYKSNRVIPCHEYITELVCKSNIELSEFIKTKNDWYCVKLLNNMCKYYRSEIISAK